MPSQILPAQISGRRISFGVVFCVLLLLLVGQGCGRRGNPKPPELTAPGAVTFLTARASVDGVTLEWQAPETDAAGEPVKGLDSFKIKPE